MAPEPLSGEQAGRLIEGIDALTGEVVGLRTQTAEQSDSLDTAKDLLMWALAAVAIAIALGLGGLILGIQGRHDRHAAKQDLQERVITNCKLQNDFYRKHNHLVADDQQNFKDILDAPQINEATRKFAQKRYDAYESDKIELRNCTPAGIQKELHSTTTTTGKG